jgi:hypothetical protein
LFLATVTCYLTCLDRVVLAHPFSALAIFPVCFSVLSRWTNTAPSTPSSLIWEKHNNVKKQYTCRMIIILCQWDFNEQIEKLVRLFLCTSENCSRIFHVWVHFVPIFLKLLPKYFFFCGSINRLLWSQNGAFIQIFQFSFNYTEWNRWNVWGQENTVYNSSDGS